MHIESLAPSRKDVATNLGSCKGCSKPGLHSFTDGIPYECFLYEQLCTETQTEISARFTIHGTHNRLYTLHIRREKHNRVVIAIENCLNTMDPTSRAAALRTLNTRRKAIAHLEARIQQDHRSLAIKQMDFAESRAAIVRIQNSIEKSERAKDPVDKEAWKMEICERLHEELRTEIRDADEQAYEAERHFERPRQAGAASDTFPMPFDQVPDRAQQDVRYIGFQGMFGWGLLRYPEEVAIKTEEEDLDLGVSWTTWMRSYHDAPFLGYVPSDEEDDDPGSSSERSSTSREQSPYELPQLPAPGSATRISSGIARPSSRRTFPQPPIQSGPARNTRGKSSRYKPYESHQ